MGNYTYCDITILACDIILSMFDVKVFFMHSMNIFSFIEFSAAKKRLDKHSCKIYSYL